MAESLKIDPIESLNQDLDESRDKIIKYKAAIKETEKAKKEFNETFFGKLDIYKGHEKEISELRHLIELENSKSKTINEAIQKEIANRERLAESKKNGAANVAKGDLKSKFTFEEGGGSEERAFSRDKQLDMFLKDDTTDTAKDNFMLPSGASPEDASEREKLGEERKEFLEKQFEEQLERNREFMLQYGEEQIRFNREEYDREKEKMLKLQLLYNSGYRGRLQMAEGFFDDIASMSKSKNSNLFKIAKTASIAMGMVNAYAGASQTLADPTLPFYAKIAAVTSVLAKGFAMVSSLKSINESGGGGGATAGGGGGATATAEAPAQIMETNVTFSGSGDVSQDQFRGFVAGLNDALDDGMTIGRITA